MLVSTASNTCLTGSVLYTCAEMSASCPVRCNQVKVAGSRSPFLSSCAVGHYAVLLSSHPFFSTVFPTILPPLAGASLCYSSPLSFQLPSLSTHLFFLLFIPLLPCRYINMLAEKKKQRQAPGNQPIFPPPVRHTPSCVCVCMCVSCKQWVTLEKAKLPLLLHPPAPLLLVCGPCSGGN